MKTAFIRKEDVNQGTVPRQCWLIDAEGQTLGRLATHVSTLLRGKHKPSYTPNIDMGDMVIVINAEKVRLTGNKMRDKIYYHHTGYPGGIKSKAAQELLEKKPESLVHQAVKRMMPKNALSRQSFQKLKIYAGSEHPHTAQQPQVYEGLEG